MIAVAAVVIVLSLYDNLPRVADEDSQERHRGRHHARTVENPDASSVGFAGFVAARACGDARLRCDQIDDTSVRADTRLDPNGG